MNSIDKSDVRVVRTYATLAAAISQMTQEQLQMSITVTEGCDINGNAEFFCAQELVLAGGVHLEAATDGVLEPTQPVLIFGNPDADGVNPFDDQPETVRAVNGERALLRLPSSEEPKYDLYFFAPPGMAGDEAIAAVNCKIRDANAQDSETSDIPVEASLTEKLKGLGFTKVEPEMTNAWD